MTNRFSSIVSSSSTSHYHYEGFGRTAVSLIVPVSVIEDFWGDRTLTMPQLSRLTNIAKLGIGLAIASPGPWLLLLVLPFLQLLAVEKVSAAAVLLIVAEAMFWVGVLLAGQEVVRRYRRELKPKAIWGRMCQLLRRPK